MYRAGQGVVENDRLQPLCLLLEKVFFPAEFSRVAKHELHYLLPFHPARPLQESPQPSGIPKESPEIKDLLTGRLRGVVCRHGGGARKQAM